MEQITTQSWLYMHFALVLCIACAQVLVVYVLSSGNQRPQGLGLFTVYFMAGLLCWITFTLQHGTGANLSLDVTAIAMLINTYILFLAVGQRTELTRGRYLLGGICLAASLAGFFLDATQMFQLHTLTTSALSAAIGGLCWLSIRREPNVGHAIIAAGAALVLAASIAAQTGLSANSTIAGLQELMFGAHSAAFALVATGFLAGILLEYRGQLNQLAVRDPLTSLPNMRGLEESLRLSSAKAARHDATTCAVLVDVDHFRQLNDSFGMDTGDIILRELSSLLRLQCRGSDILARSGGEEFLYILPETDLPGARVVAERVRNVVNENAIIVGEHSITVTASLGVAACKGTINLDLLCQDARRALFLAKQGGRNQVASVDNSPVTVTAGSEPS